MCCQVINEHLEKTHGCGLDEQNSGWVLCTRLDLKTREIQSRVLCNSVSNRVWFGDKQGNGSSSEETEPVTLFRVWLLL